MRYEVKELQVGGILDQSIRLFRDHFKFLMTLACIPFVPGVVLALVQVASMPSLGPEAPQDIPPQVMMFFSPTVIGLGVLWFLVVSITNALCTGAAAWGVTHRYLGRDVSAGECFRVVVRRFPRLIWASILYALGVGFGMMLFMIPGIYFMLAWSVMYPVMIFEDLSANKSMNRSKTLMVGHKGKAFVVGFIVWIAIMASSVFTQLVPNVYVAAILSEVVRACTMLFSAVVVVVIYISARCRTEHFDVELLTQMVEAKRTVEEPAL